MRPLRLIPPDTNFRFIALRKRAYVVSILLILASVASLAVQSLNFGIDFVGGTLIEVRTKGPADISAMRQTLSALDRGEVGLQEFGQPTDVLIRIQQQPGGDAAQQATVAAVKEALGDSVEEYRRVEVVGPKVGGELIEAGAISVALALLAIMAYIWFRFEWQFGVGAVLALAHDVITTVGVFSLLQLEFNLSTVAAVLTIAGYSINDTVVVFDRVRENLRRYKTLPMTDLLNKSVNETLSRTVMTSATTLLALLSLFFLGGEVIRDFAFAMIWGVIIGTYSSVWIASATLLWMGVRPSATDDLPDDAEVARTLGDR
ncbi:MAG: protein translocase subunit SecF [Alphaproteobacteria bacterium]|nr:protein translocase subunit SecF [Alphaproteobacteria bacterium]